MKESLKTAYVNYFTPLVSDFVGEVESLGLDLPKGLPQPFLPLFGDAYERSALRMVIVGQDTKWWGCLRNFIEKEKTSPGKMLTDEIDDFQNLNFIEWGSTRYTFWGFVMMFLGVLYGRSDWGVMKQGVYREILSSFGWGNGNSVEYYNSSPKNISPSDWDRIRQAGRRFDRIQHILDVLHPRVVVVLWGGMNPDSYFEGCEFSSCGGDGEIHQYRIPASNVDVFHLPHPGRMRWEAISADHICTKLVGLLRAQGLTVDYPQFVRQHQDSATAIEYLKNTVPTRSDAFDKFAFVEWMAEELTKNNSFMSVPTLCDLPPSASIFLCRMAIRIS